MNILFLHGWQSIPGGVKPTYLAQHGHTVINPKLPDEDFAAALAIAQAELDQHKPDVIVGSSRGGALAMNLNTPATTLVLLCPAWKKYGSARTIRANSTILHSRADEVILYADSEELVRNSGLPAYTLVETGNDHRLADPESLEIMLEACRMGKDEEDEEGPDIMGKDWTGLCYTAALTWAKEAEEDWVLVHGMIWSDTAGKWIEHAWCERGDFVVDLALSVGRRIVAKEIYYRSGKPVVRKTYSADEARDLSVKHRHNGPWDGGGHSESRSALHGA